MSCIRSWLVAALFAVVAGHAAAASASVYLEELTWTELRDAIAAGKTTVIVPVGGTEQSGPHMVLGKHNVRAKALAGAIATALGNALVAPVIAYVPEGSVEPPSAHMRFPGTITVTPAAFESVLDSTARSLRAHGFRDIVFLGDHGGYQRNEEAVAKRLDREWAKSPTRVLALADYYRATDVEYPAALAERGYTKAEIGTHAGLADTSLTLAVDPSLVRTGELASSRSLDAAHGVYGDPRRASADLGRLGVETIVRRSVESIRRATAPR